MQRILEPGEIQALDATAWPRVALPERVSVFAARAKRLRELADGNSIGGYLRLMAVLVDAQHAVLAGLGEPVIDTASMRLAQQHGMPIVPAISASLNPQWRAVLAELIARIEASSSATGAPASFASVLARLRRMSATELDAQAAAQLDRDRDRDLDLDTVDPALAPFIHAALEVMWTQRACALAPEDMPYLDAPGLCLVCGSPPVASIVRVGGAFDGYRYLQCSLCATQAHCVRVKCSNCSSTKGIAYQSIEGSPEGTRAESCDECHSYRKIFAQNKLYDAEPFADDLASLALDLMMNQAGYSRPDPHPFLWPARGDEDEENEEDDA
jgi:FdhE protein